MGELIRLDTRRRAAPAAPPRRGPEPLWRDVLGRRLRVLRQVRGERLTDVAARAGIAPQYLSELERGRKDPSSEVLAAVAGALELPLRSLVALAGDDLARGTPVLLAA